MIDSIGSVKANKDGDFDTAKRVEPVIRQQEAAAVNAKPVQPKANIGGKGETPEDPKKEKEPSQNTIESVMYEANQKMRMTKTRCEYSYDEPTKRVSIKVFDEKTDELIREVPPEKSLEMLQKMWELAGIIVDEKR